MPFLSQASHLGSLLLPHDAFQEHAAHPAEWSAELNSKGSESTCILSGLATFLPCAFTAHSDLVVDQWASPVKVIHLLSFCYTTGLLHRHSEGGHHAGQSIRTFCGEKSYFRHGTWHVGTRPGSGATRCLVCPDGAEAVHPYLIVFDRLYIAQPGRLSHQALGACSLSGPRRRGWGFPHLGLQQTQRGRDPHLGRTGAL